MVKRHALVSVLGGGGAAVLAGFLLPTAIAGADDGADGGSADFKTCEGGVCLVQDSDTSDWDYTGLRPFITDWMGTQPYTVETTHDDGGTVEQGSYSITAQDIWTPISSYSHYQYGEFTPSAEAGADPDLGAFADMSGASIYDIGFFDGTFQGQIFSNVDVHGHELNYYATSLGDFTNVTVWDPVNNTAGDYIQSGGSDPQWLFSELFHGDRFPAVPDYLIPGDQFAGADFDSGDFVDPDEFASAGSGL
jgi:hypothetical protein